MRSRLAYSGRIMNGRKLYVMPAITAPVVASTRPSSETSPTACSTFTTAPESLRMVCQDRVRIRYVTKNGTITSSNSAVFHLPPRNAIA